MPGARLLRPPAPIMLTESNWPLLTVSKGFFDGLKATRGGLGGNVPSGPAVSGVTSALAIDESGMDVETGGGWDDDENQVWHKVKS